MLAAVFGVAWVVWGAAGLAGSGAVIVRCVGIAFRIVDLRLLRLVASGDPS
jgi:hypothetical protein